MWNQRFPLSLVLLLACSGIGHSQEEFDPRPEDPEPQFFCNAVCCGDPVPIPDEQNFQMFVIPFETEEQTVFSGSISKAQARENLSADFLQPETIEEMSNYGSNFYQVDSSAVAPFQSHRCDIPISKACLVQKCGCNATGRKLLQCFPVLACSASTSGAVQDADLESTIVLPPWMMFGICLADSCTLFQIQPQNGRDMDLIRTTQCPDNTPVPAVATTTPATSTEGSSPETLGSIDNTALLNWAPPPPPPPPPTETTTTVSKTGSVESTTTTSQGSSTSTSSSTASLGARAGELPPLFLSNTRKANPFRKLPLPLPLPGFFGNAG